MANSDDTVGSLRHHLALRQAERDRAAEATAKREAEEASLEAARRAASPQALQEIKDALRAAAQVLVESGYKAKAESHPYTDSLYGENLSVQVGPASRKRNLHYSFARNPEPAAHGHLIVRVFESEMGLELRNVRVAVALGRAYIDPAWSEDERKSAVDAHLKAFVDTLPSPDQTG